MCFFFTNNTIVCKGIFTCRIYHTQNYKMNSKLMVFLCSTRFVVNLIKHYIIITLIHCAKGLPNSFSNAAIICTISHSHRDTTARISAESSVPNPFMDFCINLAKYSGLSLITDTGKWNIRMEY